MRLCLKLINVLFFSLFFSWQAHSAQYEFGTFDTSTCSSFILSESAAVYEDRSGCVVRLKNTYATKPLVFLMPTIPSDNPDDDAPQTLALLNVTKKSFSVAQIVAPLSNFYSLSRNQMPVISYLVVEEGVTTFEDGHRVFAGSVNTTRYSADGKRSSPAYERVDLSSYPSLLSGSPIVLSEVQTKNNKRWLTTATKNISSMEFDLGLEITRVNKRDIDVEEHEKIGYLVSVPNIGETNGYDYEFSSGDIVSNSGKFKPLKYTCDTPINLRQTYTTVPNFIAGKLQRQGGQGGWVRQCKKSLKQVSFVVDEDIPPWTYIGQRAHIKEKVGFFAFAKKEVSPPSSNDYCEYFPSVAQSHYDDSYLVMMGIKGPYIKNNTSEKFELGFEKSAYDGNIKSETCRNIRDKWECTLNESLIVQPYDDISSVPDGTINNVYHYDKNTPLELDPGAYKNIEVGQGTTVILSSGKYTIEKLSLRKDSIFKLRDKNKKTEVYVRNADLNGKVNTEGRPENLYIFGVTKDSDLNQGTDYMPASIKANETAEIVAYIYSVGNVLFSANYTSLGVERKVTLRGAVTARNIRLDTESNIIGDGICINPPDSNYTLEITPTEHYSLTCDDLLVAFNVKKESGELANNFNGTVTVSADIEQVGLAYWSLPNDDSTSFDAYTPIDVMIKNGQGRMRLHSPNYIGNIEVIGKATDASITNDVEGNYTFVPFKFGFKPSPIKTIAGKPISVTISALACNDGTVSVATGYNGNKELTINTTFIAPREMGNGKIEIRKPNGNTWQREQETLNFSAGVANFDLKYSDTGKVSLSVSDPNCSLETGCDSELTSGTEEEYDGWELLEGSVEVHARPWTFAVCPKNQDGEYIKADGTSLSGDGFVASGDPFKVIVKPLVWQGGSEAEPIQTTDELCLAKTTQNFFKSDAPIADVELSIPNTASVTPVDGKSGVLRGTVRKSHTDELEFSDLSWSEVGSVRLQADAKAPYLAMTINQGYRHLGRFYPKYLEIQPNSFVYPDGHGVGGNSFAYLNQPFNANVLINAKNALGEQVDNYNGFIPAYQAEVALIAYEYPSLNSLNDRFSYHHITRSTEQSFKGRWNSDIEQVWLLERKPVAKTPLTTVEDGPWNDSNSRWGGYISSHHDPIFIRNTATGVTDDVDSKQVAPFEITPNLRYGRMVLDDAISPFDQPVSLPLKIEYWNGSEFQTHTDDSGSTYNSSYYCKLALHPVDGANTSILTTNITGKVSVGESDEIEAHPQLSTPANYKKQQTRFWLRIATNTPANIGCSQTNKEYQPWLTYNWRELGDEDPSAIVTFGVYRGSDRIVYRGEKGLN
ncbi:MSHA biogenesis protein MshQ [Photobacterium angustum]|uniref:MSHA biogenesis protein MshQ n=1 Tax=Photobacterium angustum TaxID=661 RepID=A0A855SBR6_PHOAN|nr:DUF6701 domain-containing protein [Photobacterium angustum]KJF81136.1 MSHA biogenesis protein MshQ [Photobacterium damselae subsp. damselae]KJG29550.1 MSHA biogenesis protein MshQ [Photobacterium angustum]KJG39284.1 MSHA biogenesis protein MshQ [Photobacterium angustum]KJG44648.1 MSHA biogenesis protein MshQ [Photobacterium angustum]KJG48319.1 MSHA biogenesis protein MshQ [Photobacterium angustum]